MNNLTKIAALPGSGGGSMSASTETLEQKKYGPSMTHQEMAAHIDALMGVVERLLERVGSLEASKVEVITVWPTIEAFKATVQMKAPYFDHSKDWTPVYYKADSHDELAFPPIDLGEIGGDGA